MPQQSGSSKAPEKSAEKKPEKGAERRQVVTRARRNAQLQMEHNENVRRLAMLRRRVELAQAGVRAFESHKITDAVKNFQTYLRILEDWKGVPDGGLTPSLFDPVKDMAELLLISGVYWDLIKLYDRTRSPDKRQDLLQYLDKYVIFSKGMKYEHVCSETLRKYISNNKSVHAEEFKAAYKRLGGDQDRCFVATSLIDVCDLATLPRLRAFRDERLARSRAGRAFIRWYYRNGPHLAAAADLMPRPLRRAMGWALDRFAATIVFKK